jgi:hypothetical protein
LDPGYSLNLAFKAKWRGSLVDPRQNFSSLDHQAMALREVLESSLLENACALVMRLNPIKQDFCRFCSLSFEMVEYSF